jgi:hypothetical protein
MYDEIKAGRRKKKARRHATADTGNTSMPSANAQNASPQADTPLLDTSEEKSSGVV